MKKLLPILVLVMLLVAGGTTYYAYSLFVGDNKKDSIETVNADVEINEQNIEELLNVLGEEYKQKHNVSLTAREVQYDMTNNIDKDFYVEGVLKLCDYYNYGFTNQEGLFCGRLTPFDGKYSESWNLYFDRETYKTLYDKSLSEEVIVRGIAVIPQRAYKRNQGNMARVKKMEWY